MSAPSLPRYRSHSPWPRVVRALGIGLAGAVVLEAVTVVLGVAVVGRHGGGPIQGWDNTVGHWWLSHRAHLVRVSKVVAVAFDAPLLAVISVALTAILLALRQGMRALIPVVAYLGGEFFVYFTRIFVHRPRPITAKFPAPGAVPGVHETSYSFPSGHATAGSAVLLSLGLLAVITWRTWWPWLLAVLLTLAALGVACTRLILGVHWFSDVAFGLSVGLCWGVVVALALKEVPWPLGRHRGGPGNTAGRRPDLGSPGVTVSRREPGPSAGG